MRSFDRSKRFGVRIAVAAALLWLVSDSARAQHGHHGGGHGHGHAGHGFSHGGHGFSHGGHALGHVGAHVGHGLGHVGHGIGHQLGYAIGHGTVHHGAHVGVDHHVHAGGHHDIVHGYYGGGHYAHPYVDLHSIPYYSGYGYASVIASPYYGYYSPAPVSVSPGLVTTLPNTLSDRHTVAKSAVSENAVASPPSIASDRTEPNEYQAQAEQAFRNSAYDQAVRLAGHALVESPNDGKLMLLYAQGLFAIGDYDGAAGAIHRAASLLEPEDWGYVVENYANYYRGNGFVDQMQRLEGFLESNPDAAAARFLRGYQYGFLGQTEVAIRDLNRALQVESRDQLAAELVHRFGGTPTAVPAVESAPLNDSRDEPIQIDSPPPPIGGGL